MLSHWTNNKWWSDGDSLELESCSKKTDINFFHRLKVQKDSRKSKKEISKNPKKKIFKKVWFFPKDFRSNNCLKKEVVCDRWNRCVLSVSLTKNYIKEYNRGGGLDFISLGHLSKQKCCHWLLLFNRCTSTRPSILVSTP